MSSHEPALDIDQGRNLVGDPEARRARIRALRGSLREDDRASRELAPFTSEPGISIIVPTHKGEDRIGTLLATLANQTISPERFEVIVIENGERDETERIVHAFGMTHPVLQIRYFYRPAPSAGGARNLGIQLARMSRTTLVDDDDTLQPRFLESALALSTGNNLVLSPIINATEDGELDELNVLNQRIAKISQKNAVVTEVPWALGLNACKLVPTWMIKTMQYDEELRSGEDLVFWAQVLTRPATEVVAVSARDSSYVRLLRANSISRRETDWQFSVVERLAAIKALESINLEAGSPASDAVEQMAKSQAGFIKRYIEENAEEYSDVVSAIERAKLRSFPWSILTKGRAQDLAFLYCFAPFSDTSAIVAAKAIAERELVVDVITQDMSKVRRKDPAASALADKWVDQRVIIPGSPSFGDWKVISKYATEAVAAADQIAAHKTPYRTVYSRALWVGSHVAAALYKLRHWQIRWTAEFSDPLQVDAEGKRRSGAVTETASWTKLSAAIRARGFEYFEPTSVFDLAETAAFVLADELIFTNANQLEYMLSLVDDPKLRDLARSKATVREHPTPPQRAYDAVTTSYEVPRDTVNLAYFGSFYPNRGIGDVLIALSGLRQRLRRAIRLHVFSNKADEVRRQAATLGISHMVYSNGYLSYMEFLNATRLFDVLIVNDVDTTGGLPINPFLPSKFSDYKGSGRKIWAITESGSPLSTKEVAYMSPVGNSAAMIPLIEQIIGERKYGHGS